MRAYLAVFSARFRALLQYRAAALAGVGTQFFWGLIRMMIFTAFIKYSAADSPMSLEEVITYIWLGQAFFALVPLRVDMEVAMMIRSGNIAYELLRPVDLYNYWLMRAIAARIAPTLMKCIPILVVASIVGWIKWPGPAGLAAFTVTILGAVVLSSAYTTIMTIMVLRTVSARGFNQLLAMISWIGSGLIIPLPLFPDAWQTVLNILPFRGLGDVPFRLFTGHIAAAEVGALAAHQLAWILVFVFAGRLLLAGSLKRVVVQGG